jgi:hypothetical protein
MSDERPDQPEQPIAAPRPAAAEVEQAIAAFDAQQHARAAHAKPVVTPFSLRDVDRRIWIFLGILVALVAISLGGPPWQASFWITLGFTALLSSPLLFGAVFLWQRNR